VHSLVANTFVQPPSTQCLASDLVQSNRATSVGGLAACDSLRLLKAEQVSRREGGAVQHQTRCSLQG